MFDFMRDRGSTAEEKRLEALGAYLDDALTADERRRFENQLAGDAELRAELEHLRALKMQLRAMPRRRVPRSFALDPALYGRPKRQPMMQFYPLLRGATALTAFFLIFTLALGAFRGQFSGGVMGYAAPQTVAFEAEAVEESAVEEELARDSAPVESPAEAPAAGATDRARPTVAASEATENLELLEAEALPLPAAGTAASETADAPPGAEMAELEIESTVAAAEPTIEEFSADLAAQSSEADGEATTTSSEVVAERDADWTIIPLLLPLQIGLAVAFLLCLILLLIARRRSRSF